MQTGKRLAKLIVKLTCDHGPFIFAHRQQVCREGTQLIPGTPEGFFRLLQTNKHDVTLTDNRVHLLGPQDVNEFLCLLHLGLQVAVWRFLVTHRSSRVSLSASRTCRSSLRLPNTVTLGRGLIRISVGWGFPVPHNNMLCALRMDICPTAHTLAVN